MLEIRKSLKAFKIFEVLPVKSEMWELSRLWLHQMKQKEASQGENMLADQGNPAGTEKHRKEIFWRIWIFVANIAQSFELDVLLQNNFN